MNKFLLTLLGILFLTQNLWAHFDLSAGAQGRTLPSLGAEVYADAGYSQKIWGKREVGDKNVLFGLIRPSITASSSAVVNSFKAELEFFPISFLGFAAGRQYMNSNYEFPFLNCDQVICRGEYIRNYVESKMALGAGGWITLLSYRYDTIRAPHNGSGRQIADWRHVIAGAVGHDVQIENKFLFAKIIGNQMYGFLAEHARFEGSGEYKESYAAVYQYKPKDVAYMFGAGTFHSSRQPTGLIFYFRINASLIPSLKLF